MGVAEVAKDDGVLVAGWPVIRSWMTPSGPVDLPDRICDIAPP